MQVGMEALSEVIMVMEITVLLPAAAAQVGGEVIIMVVPAAMAR